MVQFLKIRPSKEQEFWGKNDEFSFVPAKLKVCGSFSDSWPRVVSVLAQKVLHPRKPSVLGKPVH